MKAYDIEDREDRERMLREQNRILNEELLSLKTKLAQASKRADSWQEAYNNAMDTMAKMSRSKT
jgi:phage shock protein A